MKKKCSDCCFCNAHGSYGNCTNLEAVKHFKKKEVLIVFSELENVNIANKCPYCQSRQNYICKHTHFQANIIPEEDYTDLPRRKNNILLNAQLRDYFINKSLEEQSLALEYLHKIDKFNYGI